MKQNFPPALLLRRERQRHQNSDPGDSHRQPAAHRHESATQKEVEFLQLGHGGRILLMCYVNFHAFFEQPEKRWEIILSNRSPGPPEPDLFG